MVTRSARRWWALAAVMVAVLAVGLDGTILVVALPTLATALHATESDLEWFSSAYLLALAAAMLPAGVFGDRFGRKRVMLVSLALFGVGSAACAYAPTAGAFVAARFVVGVAGAGVIVMALSALTVLFTEEERPRAVGVWAAANFLALPVGPILGGWLLTHYWWGWVFLLNVPVVLAGLLVTAALVPETRAPERPGLDLFGALLSIAGLVSVIFGLVQAGTEGWGAAATLVPIVGGLVLMGGFFAWEAWLGRRPKGQPLVDLALFHSAAFTWSVILLAILVVAMTGVLFTLPQYFQGVLGTDAMGSGLRLLPLIAGLVVGALPADQVARRFGAKRTIALGFLIVCGGMCLGGLTRVDSSENFLAAWIALVGLGMGITLATAATEALNELTPERSGVGSAVLQALQKTGGPFGAAVFGSVLSAVYQADLSLGGLPPALAQVVRSSLFGGVAVAGRLNSAPLLASVRTAFVAGMDRSLLFAAGMAALGVVLSVLFLPRRIRATGSSAHAAESIGSTVGTV